jgi:hypothetical protein
VRCVWLVALAILAAAGTASASAQELDPTPAAGGIVNEAVRHDVSPPLASLKDSGTPVEPLGAQDENQDTARAGSLAALDGSVEQTFQGPRPPVPLTASFDGLGFGFVGPQGTSPSGNPSDNSIAVGPNHIVERVNTRTAIYTKRGDLFDTTGTVLYGAVTNNTIFAGFGGQCENRNSGDAVVRYDQLADRWLYVNPIFQRPPGDPQGPFSMCYAVSVGPDPLGPYYRYEFLRPLFPDYPRPAVWPDGYYVPTSTGDAATGSPEHHDGHGRRPAARRLR